MYLGSVRKRVFIRGSGREPPPSFFSSFESCVTGSRSYQAFSWFFGPCSLASKENRGEGFPFFSNIWYIWMFADKDGWKLVSFNVYFIVLRWLRSSGYEFFSSLVNLSPSPCLFVSPYPLNARTKKQISHFWLKRNCALHAGINCNPRRTNEKKLINLYLSDM